MDTIYLNVSDTAGNMAAMQPFVISIRATDNTAPVVTITIDLEVKITRIKSLYFIRGAIPSTVQPGNVLALNLISFSLHRNNSYGLCRSSIFNFPAGKINFPLISQSKQSISPVSVPCSPPFQKLYGLFAG